MKKILNMRYIMTCFALIGALSLQSCNEEDAYDVMGTTQNLVYLNTRTGGTINIPKNSFVFNVANTPIGSYIAIDERVEAKIAAQCTHQASNDITVKFEVDNSLIMEGYEAIPSNVPLNLEKTELIIPKGELITNDKMVLSIDSIHLQLLVENSYMVPVKITSVTNAGLSNNLSIAYVIINTINTNVYNFVGANDMVGSFVTDKSQWTGFVSMNLVSGSLANMFNTNTNSFWRVDPGDNIYNWGVNFAELKTGITGIRIHVNNAAVNFTKLHVYSSDDGENWESQGITELTIGATFQYIKFYSPIDTQYLKFEVLGRRHGTQTRVALFDIYTE